MAHEIFDNDGNYLDINADGSLNVTDSSQTVLSGQLDQLETYGIEDYIESTYMREIQTAGTNTYIAHAVPGSALSASVWRAQKVDTDGSRTWADGNINFDNVATDLSGLTYS